MLVEYKGVHSNGHHHYYVEYEDGFRQDVYIEGQVEDLQYVQGISDSMKDLKVRSYGRHELEKRGYYV